MVTLKEVAARCGCSVATVSKALNGLPDISARTARRVRAVAREMGYRPNTAALALKTNRSRTIGLLFFLRDTSVWRHDYFACIAESIQQVTEKEGYDITPINAYGDSIIGNYLDYCRTRGYDGLVAMCAGVSDASLTAIIESEIPLVTIDDMFEGRAAVLSDNVQGMRDLVRFAHDRGHRRIAFVHGEDTGVTWDRLRGFDEAARALGLQVPEGYVRPCIYRDQQASAEATCALLAMDAPPTCILYPDDYAALGGMRALRDMGLSVPEDISVAGYDGIALAQVLGLTTVAQDHEGIGRHAAGMLLQTMQKQDAVAPKHVLLPGRVVDNGSIGGLA